MPSFAWDGVPRVPTIQTPRENDRRADHVGTAGGMVPRHRVHRRRHYL